MLIHETKGIIAEGAPAELAATSTDPRVRDFLNRTKIYPKPNETRLRGSLHFIQMKTKLSPTLAGTFVIGALVLIGRGAADTAVHPHVFSKPGHFVAYFNESVQGLDVGSAVKLRGVPLGRVKSIRVHYDRKPGNRRSSSSPS